MKLFVVVLVCLVAASQQSMLSDEQKAKIMQFHQECKAESKVDDAVCLKAKAGEYVDDPKLKEHLFCFNKKAGFQNAAGDIQVDAIKAKLNDITKNEKLTNEIVDKCAIKKDTPQETAFESMKCFHQFAPKQDLL